MTSRDHPELAIILPITICLVLLALCLVLPLLIRRYCYECCGGDRMCPTLCLWTEFCMETCRRCEGCDCGGVETREDYGRVPKEHRLQPRYGYRPPPPSAQAREGSIDLPPLPPPAYRPSSRTSTPGSQRRTSRYDPERGGYGQDVGYDRDPRTEAFGQDRGHLPSSRASQPGPGGGGQARDPLRGGEGTSHSRQGSSASRPGHPLAQQEAGESLSRRPLPGEPHYVTTTTYKFDGPPPQKIAEFSDVEPPRSVQRPSEGHPVRLAGTPSGVSELTTRLPEGQAARLGGVSEGQAPGLGLPASRGSNGARAGLAPSGASDGGSAVFVSPGGVSQGAQSVRFAHIYENQASSYTASHYSNVPGRLREDFAVDELTTTSVATAEQRLTTMRREFSS